MASPLEVKKRFSKSRSKPYERKSKSTFKHSASAYACENAIRNINNSPNADCEESAVNVLNELNFKYEVSSNDNKAEMMFIQDKLMEKFFAYYPEFFCIDYICEIPELDKFLILFIGVDTNGHCEIVSLGLIKKNPQSFIWICDMFKKHNPDWEKVELILSDDKCDREILHEAFPGKFIFTSFYHCMKAFKIDLSNFDNGTIYQDVNRILQIFEQMMFVTSEMEYTQLMKQMKQLNGQAFNLFKNKWHAKRNLWALGLYTDSKMFLKAFNTYLLNIRKLKPMISNQEMLENVIRNLHSAIYKLRKEWFLQISKMLHSPSAVYLKVPVMQKYVSFITPFATELVYEQLKKSEDMKNLEKIDRHGFYKVADSLVTSNSCSCNFNKFMKLPCSHIFSVRKHLLLPLYIQSVRSSWIITNYHDNFFSLYSAHISEHKESKEIINRYQEYVRTSHELWKEIFNCSESISQERLETFQNILKAWKNDFKVTIIRSDKQNDSLCSSIETLENLPTDHFKEMYGISINDIINNENEFMDVSLCSEGNIELL